jgi:hypothetical protein
MYFEAVFSPANQTEYNSEAEDLIGKRIPIQEGWIIDKGPHKGERCFYAPHTTIGTIPQSDLKNIKSVSYVQWKQLHSSINLEKQ